MSVRALYKAACVALVSTMALGGCLGGGGGSTGPSLSRVEVTPTNPSIANGTTKQFAATAVYSDSTTKDVTSSANWASSNTAVATISNTAGSQGVATGTGAGTATITATFNGVAGTTSLIVTAAVVTGVQVTPSNPSIAKGTSQQFIATAIFSDNTTQTVTQTATWSSTNTSVAPVDDTSSKGLATGANTGTATISAVYSGHTGSTGITVTAAVVNSIEVTPADPSIAKGTTQPFTATAIFSDNTNQDVTANATWGSSNTGIATLAYDASGNKEIATGAGTGTATISATYGGQSGSTGITVTAAVINSIQVTAQYSSIRKGDTDQFTATAVYSDAHTQDVTTASTWSSSNSSFATVSNAAGSNGLATGTGVGTATITAVFNGVTGFMDLPVTAATLTGLDIAPTTPTIAKGTNQPFSATAHYSDGSNADVTSSTTWSSSDTSVATISNSNPTQGLAVGQNMGTSTITGAFGGQTTSTDLMVSAATLTSIHVTPSNQTMAVGFKRQYTATGTFSDSSTQDLTTAVTWSSTDPTKASISNASGTKGQASTVAAGATSIVAQLNSVSGSTTLTVTGDKLCSVTVAPSSMTIAYPATQQFTATAAFSGSTPSMDVTTQVAWTSSNTSAATINPNSGLATSQKVSANANTTITAQSAVTAGSALTCQAAMPSNSGTATLTVTAAALVSIEVTPGSTSVPKGLTTNFKATGTYTDNTTNDITSTVTWASSNTSFATIDNSGKATGVSPGTVTISAAMSGKTGTATLQVTNAVVTAITITPGSTSVGKGSTVQYTAKGDLSDGTKNVDITTQAFWASDATTIATISNASGSQGLATTSSSNTGTAHITAAKDGVTSNSATLNVTAATLSSISVCLDQAFSNCPANFSLAKGTSRQLYAKGTYSDSTVQDVTASATWNSDSANAAVSDASGSKGFLVANSTGAANIKASESGVNGTLPVAVTAATLTSIAVTPANGKVPVGYATQYTATGTFSDSSTQDLTSQVTWSSQNTSAATVSNAAGSQGVVTGVAAGSATLLAAKGVVSGSTPVTVTNATLSSIAVTPQNGHVNNLNATSLQLTATGTFSDASTLNITTQVTWNSSNTTSVNVSSTGNCTPGTLPGSSTITAAKGAVNGTTTVTNP